jgi:MFS family permease
MAVVMLVVAPSSARLVERFGTKRVVTTGLSLAALGLGLLATLPSHGISYWGDVAWRMMVMAAGMGLTMAPATESIMGSLPRAKAGVGSAVNDTTRQVGGALGVAIIGSVMSSFYGSRVVTLFTRMGLSGAPISEAKQGLGHALDVAGNPSVPLAPGQRAEVVSGAKDAFVAGLHRGVLVAAGAALLGAIIAARWLPARAADTEVFVLQDKEEAKLEAAFVGEA